MIHPTAIIAKGVQLGEEVKIGPYSVIEEGVSLAKGVAVSAFANIKGRTSIGENTFVGTGAIIGEKPQVIGIGDSVGKVHIGKNNIIREYVTIHSSMHEDKDTVIGDNNFLMAFSHVAHDCRIADGVVICNGALLAGHIQVADSAFISGNVVIHQFVRVGRLAMIGGLARVNQDVPPFMMLVGDSRVWGINAVGLRRAKFSRKDFSDIKSAYNYLYRKDLPLKAAIEKLEKIKSEKVKEMIVFVLGSSRGICGPKRSGLFEKIFLDYPYFARSKIPAYELFSRAPRHKA